MYFYQVNVQYQKQTGEDNPGRVKESYLVEAELQSAAESRVLEHVAPYIFGDCQVQKIQKRQFFDVFRLEEDAAGVPEWFEAKVEMITVDGDRETRKAVNMLVEDSNIHYALKSLKRKLDSYDCEIISIKKSPILELLTLNVPVDTEH